MPVPIWSTRCKHGAISQHLYYNAKETGFYELFQLSLPSSESWLRLTHMHKKDRTDKTTKQEKNVEMLY